MKRARISVAMLIVGLRGSAHVQAPAVSPTHDPTSMPDPRMLRMDKDGDGKISRQQIRQNWDCWDVNQDGYIDTAEFSAGGQSKARAGTPQHERRAGDAGRPGGSRGRPSLFIMRT